MPVNDSRKGAARVLIVDDERVNQQVLEAMLAPEGMILELAASGEEALAMMALHPPDLVLLDIMMPGMDGYQVAAEIKSNSATRNIPVIMITALDDRNARVLGLTAGAEDFLSKPVDRVELCVRVRNLLRLKAYGDYHDRYSQLLETEVAQRTEALRTADERMRFALTNANVGIWDLDYAAGLDAFVEQTHPDDRAALRETLQRAAVSGHDFMVDHREILPDGSVRWLSHSGRFQVDDWGQGTRCVGISQDVTERRALQDQFQQAQKMEVVGRLASGVAHDFNNLLTVILGFTEFVHADLTVGERQRRDLGEVMKAATRASGITRQLLAFSRQQRLRTAPLDLNVLIRDMTAMLERLAGSAVQISLVLAPDLLMTLADSSQLEQVIMNLVVNARDAMPEGGRLQIETRNVELDNSAFHHEPVVPGRYVMVAVTDTGTGMTKDVQRRLFEPFFTTKEVGKGTGLGLSTTYGIVQQTKGHIWVDSELGQGTTFRVYLPQLADETVAQPAALRIQPVSVTASETLLLVEDEPVVRQLSTRMLEQAGYRVVIAANGDEAERMYLAAPDSIDLVVSDVVMPGCGGPELMRRLRARVPSVRALLMSGQAERVAPEAAPAGGDVPFIQKPFTAAELLRVVRDALDRPPPPPLSEAVRDDVPSFTRNSADRRRRPMSLS